MKTARRGVGPALVALREARGWSQSDLALQANLFRSNLCLIEKNRRPLGPIVAAKLESVLGLAVQELMQPGQLRLGMDFANALRRDDLVVAAAKFLREVARLSVKGGCQVWEVPINGHAALVLAPKDTAAPLPAPA